MLEQAIWILIGIVQGVTEWLPVSSKTAVALTLNFVGIKLYEAYSLGLIINSSAAVAATYYFRKEVLGILRALTRPLASDYEARLLRFVVIATLTTAITGIPLYIATKLFLRWVSESLMLVIIGVFLAFTGFLARQRERFYGFMLKAVPTMSAAVVVGLAQGVAALPGISRSGITVATLIALGYSGEDCFRYSFILAIPATIFGALLDFTPSLLLGVRSYSITAIDGLLIFVVAVAVSLLTMDMLLRVAAKTRVSWIAFGLAAFAIAAAFIV